MDKYTYKDIIIDPQDERLNGAIGKEVYYSDNPSQALIYANTDKLAGKLVQIYKTNVSPFGIVDGREKNIYVCIILKKEPEVEYVPFDLSKKEDREALRDKWTRHKYLKIELKITNFEIQDGIWYANGREGGILFRNYTFLDGSPVGKKVEK